MSDRILVVRRGVDEYWKWTIKDPDTMLPRDLTGASVYGTVRASYSLSDPVLYEWSDADGNTSTTDEGIAKIEFPAADSEAATWREGYCEIRIQHATGEIEQLFEGRISISPSVIA